MNVPLMFDAVTITECCGTLSGAGSGRTSFGPHFTGGLSSTTQVRFTAPPVRVTTTWNAPEGEPGGGFTVTPVMAAASGLNCQGRLAGGLTPAALRSRTCTVCTTPCGGAGSNVRSA